MYSTQQLFKAGILLTAIAASTQAFAAPVGRVLFTSGEVRIIAPDGSSRVAKRGDTVQSGERIQTATGALGQVQMNDGARVAVRSDSRLRFDVPSTQAKAAQLSLESGNVRVLNIAAKGEAAIPPLEVKTADGDVLMRQADAVVANVKSGEGAGGEQNLIVRVDQGTGQLSTTASAERTTLSTGNAVAINAGRIEQFTGNLGSTAQVPVSTTAVRRPTSTAIATVTPLNLPTAPTLRPSAVATSIKRPLATLPRSPLRPVSSLVPTVQLPVVFADRAPAIVIRNDAPTGRISLAPAVSALGSIVGGRTVQSTSIRQLSQTDLTTAPIATITGDSTTISGTPLISGRTITSTTTTTSTTTLSSDLTVTLSPRISTEPTLISR